MNLVIGSGPAGVACADALASRGEEVTVLDAGLTLEPSRQVAADRLAERPVDEWDPAEVADLRGGVRPDANGLIRKLVYGSDFPYRKPDVGGSLESEGVALVPSYALGGLSNVWGASLLPYGEDEFDGWPISREDLAPYYREALEMMLVSAVSDGLAADFPLFGEPDGALDPGRQGRALLDHLEKNRQRLVDRGIRYGRARLGVRVEPKVSGAGCVYCGQCLVGCPYGLIYNSADTLDGLRRSGVRHEPGYVVEEIAEEAGQPIARGRTTEGDRFERRADRIFLAAGVMNSTRILLRSMGRYDEPVRILDSRYFLLPLLGRWAPGDRFHTLSQVFLEVENAAVGPRRVHLQVYGYNEMYAEAVDGALWPLRAVLGPATRPLKRRLLAIQGYLHSDLSPGIQVRLVGSKDAPRMIAEPEEDGGESERLIRQVGGALIRAAGATGLLPLLPLLKPGEPGRGFHSGGSFPMGTGSGATTTDPEGRPEGFERVHVVDSTVFPSIPSGPITLTAMANARRIAHAASAGQAFGS